MLINGDFTYREKEGKICIKNFPQRNQMKCHLGQRLDHDSPGYFLNMTWKCSECTHFNITFGT